MDAAGGGARHPPKNLFSQSYFLSIGRSKRRWHEIRFIYARMTFSCPSRFGLSLRCALSVAALGGCTEPTCEDEGTCATMGELEVGTGEWQYEPFEDGDELPLIRGAQGGFHVWVSVRSADMATGNAQLSIETQLADDSSEPQESNVTLTLHPSEATDVQSEFIGWPAVIARPGCFAGKMLRMQVSVVDQHNRHAIVERYLIPTGEDLPECITK